MNLIIFDLCNLVLLFLVVEAAFNLFWHFRFYGKRPAGQFFQTKLGKLIYCYHRCQEDPNSPGGSFLSDDTLTEMYYESPDLQMLLNLLAEKEGIWTALIILSLFDRNFRMEFKVCAKYPLQNIEFERFSSLYNMRLGIPLNSLDQSSRVMRPNAVIRERV